MPPRTRRAAAPANTEAPESPLSSPAASDTMSLPPPSPPPGPSQNVQLGLQFDEPLSWRAGKPIPVAELLRRLQMLATEMRQMDQDEDPTFKASFNKSSKELADRQLLEHKDKGVRAWVACCIVEVLRLCAPDAPFTERQLGAIFEMMVKSILSALSDPSHAYNKQHCDVLESLASVKSILLVTDQSSADILITLIFTTFFDILSGSSKASTGEQISKGVTYNMTSILVTLVDEARILPQEAVDVIIAQFLRADPHAIGTVDGKSKKGSTIDITQSILAVKELPPAYTMAQTVCKSCPDKMAREVSKYFNDVILYASGVSQDHRRDSADLDDLETSAVGPSEEDLKDLEKAHRLLRELWRACPAVLQNVIPQLEAELSAENVQLRVLATETLGDIVSGIGAAGPPPPPNLDPAAYPPPGLSQRSERLSEIDLLTKPASPQQFSLTYHRTYTSFLGRRQDKAASVRAVWTMAIGRILTTSAGGMGLSQDEESRLVEDMARMLNDLDEKVRLAAVKVIGHFTLKDVINKLGPSGSVDTLGSVLGNLAERVKDRKQAVRYEAMTVLGRIWGVAAGEIASGNSQVEDLVGGAASKILNTFYTNDQEIIVLMDQVFYEILLPMNYPPVKSKSAKQAGLGSQRVKDSQGQTNGDVVPTLDPDKIRAERMLVLAKGLDERAKKIFFALSTRQISRSRFLRAYVQACEDYNGGVVDNNEAAVKERLTRLINEMAKFFSDPTKVSGDLWKFAKVHDRRHYQLIRYCIAPESDYRTMHNGMKEFKKRVEANAPAGLSETLFSLLYQTSVILYNKSHVPAIMEFSKTDEKSLAGIAHEVLTDISQQAPEVLKAQVREICLSLQKDAPTATKPNPLGAVDSLKACAAFAVKFSEEIPQDRAFTQAMASFALYGSPPEAAKHAVSVVMAASNKKEMLAQELVKKCVKDFEYGKPGFLARLASLSRLALLAPSEVDNDADTVIDIAIKQILLQVRTPSTAAADDYTWSDEVDEECTAKCWAIRILVNRIRSHAVPLTLAEVAAPVYTLLDTLITTDGELSKAKDTPDTHKPHLRLIAARSFLKLCSSKDHDALLSPEDFNRLAEVAQDPQAAVRISFLGRLRKYLSKNTLPARFYVIPFLLAYEPVPELKSETVTWIKSRVSFFAEYKAPANSSTDTKAKTTGARVSTVLETVFARLISLLAHHPDYGDSAEDLTDFGRYIVFYLTTVANERNVSLIYHIAQRVKACEDVVTTSSATKTPAKNSTTDTTDYSNRLHTLSDLAVHTTRSLIEAHSWTLQSLPARISLPRSLFTEIKDHEKAISIAEKDFLPETVREGVEQLIRIALRKPTHPSNRKRKSEGEELSGTAKKVKSGKMPVREKEKSKKSAKRTRRSWENDESEGDDSEAGPRRVNGKTSNAKDRRTSGRVSTGKAGKSYRERDDSEDDAEMEEANDALANEDEEMSEGGTDADQQEEEDDDGQEEEEESAAEKEPPDTPKDSPAQDVEMSSPSLPQDHPQDSAAEASDEENVPEPTGKDNPSSPQPSPDPLLSSPRSTRTRTRSSRTAATTTTATTTMNTATTPTTKKSTPKSKHKSTPASKSRARTTPSEKIAAAAPVVGDDSGDEEEASPSKNARTRTSTRTGAKASPSAMRTKASASTPKAKEKEKDTLNSAAAAVSSSGSKSGSVRMTRARDRDAGVGSSPAPAVGATATVTTASSGGGGGKVTRATRSTKV